MSSNTARSGRPTRATVREHLDRVRDPELDRSIVELQYIDEIDIDEIDIDDTDIDDTDIDDTDIDGTGVRVRLRLPTAWCSPAFAWLMASDARDAVGAIPGVEDVTIRLIDHMHAEEITDGVNADLPFEEAFAEAEDDVEAVRRKLDTKARLRRQYEAMTALLEAGLTPEQAATLRREDVVVDETVGRASLQLSGLAIALDAEPLVEYIEKARETGVVTTPDDRLFATVDGEPVAPEDFEAVRREARLAKQSMEGQEAICAGLHEARYDDVTLTEPQ